MERLIPVIGIILIALILITDITAHKKLLIRRRAADWVFLCVLFCLFFSYILYSLRSINKKAGNDDTGLFLAFSYLTDGQTDAACDVANADENMTEEHRGLIGVMASAVDADYESLYLETADFIRNDDWDSFQIEICERLNENAATALAGGRISSSEMNKLLLDSFSLMEIESTEALERFYETDKAVRLNDISKISDEDISFILESFPSEREACICAVNYYLETGRPAEAEKAALSFCESPGKPLDYSVLARVFIEKAYNDIETGIEVLEDEEISDYLAKADAAEKKAAASSDEKKEDHLDAADDFVLTAQRTQYVRVLNYIDSRQWLKRDSGGYLDLQKIRLELLTGNYTAAKKDYDALVNRLPDLKASSPVKEGLIRLEAVRRRLYETKDAEEEKALLKELKDASYGLVSAADLCRIPDERENAASKSAGLLYSLLKVKKPAVNFAAVNTGSYPKLVFTVDLSFMKDGLFGQEQFYKDDLTLSDGGITVTDYNMEALVGPADKYLAVVTGLFDYGNGTVDDTEGFRAIHNVLKAIGRDSTLAEGMVYVDSALEENTSVSDTRTLFRKTVRSLDPNVKEDISGNLSKAAGLLKGKAERGKILLFITDNAEKAAELMTPEFVSGVKDNGISVYVLLIGEDTNGALDAFSGIEGFFTVESEDYAGAELAGEFVRNLIRNRYIISYKCDGKTTSGGLNIVFNSDGLSIAKKYGTEVRQ